MAQHRRAWRSLNPHNRTTANSFFDIAKVQVGARTYGPLTIDMFHSGDEGLVIGRYVSIANGVKFVLGGGHRLDTFSTFPFQVPGGLFDASTKGVVVIEDDVWIGTDALILSGVHVGRGAVIAAGSVVSKSIEPYAIYAGNPARLIRYRFPEQLIDELNETDFSRLTDELVVRNCDLFGRSLDAERLRRIKELLSNQQSNSK